MIHKLIAAGMLTGAVLGGGMPVAAGAAETTGARLQVVLHDRVLSAGYDQPQWNRGWVRGDSATEAKRCLSVSRPVYLQKRASKTAPWRTVATTRTTKGPMGLFDEYVVKLEGNRSAYFRTKIPATGDCAVGYSAPRYRHVGAGVRTRMTGQLAGFLNPYGDRVSARLTRASDGRSLAGERVKVSVQYDGEKLGTWHYLATRTTNSWGKVTVDHRIQQSCVTYKFEFAGDGTYAPRSVYAVGFCSAG